MAPSRAIRQAFIVLGAKDGVKASRHALKAQFVWAGDLGITAEMAREMRLVKGVCMVEGATKDGRQHPEHEDTYTRDLVLEGMAGLRAAAWLGQGQIDIDHYPSRLPDSYRTDHPGLGAESYPPGFPIDAQAVEHEDKMLGEFLAMIPDTKTYEMIRDHKFVGCSVMNWYRDADCSDCSGRTCKCVEEGSVFIDNTLVLTGVPNVDGTWVDVVDAEDIGTMLVNAQTAGNAGYAGRLSDRAMLTARIRNTREQMAAAQTAPPASPPPSPPAGGRANAPFESYYQNGAWVNGTESIREFLIEEKEVDADTAGEIAEYLTANPDALEPSQILLLSGADYEAWWSRHTRNMALRRLTEHENKLQVLDGGVSAPPAPQPAGSRANAATPPPSPPAGSSTSPNRPGASTPPPPAGGLGPDGMPSRKSTSKPGSRPSVDADPAGAARLDEAAQKIDADLKVIDAKIAETRRRLAVTLRKSREGHRMEGELDALLAERDRLAGIKKN